MLQDKLLIWRFNRGDSDALHAIYQKYKTDLLKLATALLHDKSSAEDAVNDAFVSFTQTMGRFRLTGSLKSYLATCVANRSRNINRAQQLRQTVTIDQAQHCIADSVSPAQSAQFSEEYQRLNTAMTQLPCPQREVLILHLQIGIKFSQIAKAQDVSVNTIKNRYRYGLDKLRTLLNSEVIK